MKCDGRQIRPQQPHILHNQRINTHLITTDSHFVRLLQLSICQDGVEGDMHLGPVQMCKAYQPFNILPGIACGSPCTETWRTDIDGIRTMLHRLHTTKGILGRTKQFNLPHVPRIPSNIGRYSLHLCERPAQAFRRPPRNLRVLPLRVPCQ